MGTYNWEVYYSGTWHDIDVNTLVFSGSATDHSVAINVDEFNSGTHLGSGDPGTHVCAGNCIYNLKYASSTQFFGGSSTTSETISNTNITITEATIRCKFTDVSAVAVTGGQFYCFDGTTDTVEAVGIQAYACEVGVGSSNWTEINDDAGGIGGNNSGERLVLTTQSTATEHYFYLAITASPQTYGAKTQFDFAIALTFS